MSIIILILLICVLLVAYTYILNKSVPKNFPPGPPRIPIFGSYLTILLENYKFSHLALRRLCEKYNTKVLGFYLGDIPAVSTCDYELTKLCFNKEEFLGKGFSIMSEARGQGSKIGLFFTDGPFWQEQRRFSLRHLRDFGFGRRFDNLEEVISGQVKDLLNLLQNGPQNEDDMEIARQGEIYMPDTFFGYYQVCIWYILCGQLLELKDLRRVINVAMGFQRCIDGLGGIISFAPWTRHIAPKLSGYQAAKDDNYQMYLFCKKIVDEHWETYQEDHHRDFIDVYISEIKKLHEDNIFNSSFSRQQLNYIVLDVMFPAGVAMGHTTNFFFGYLVHYPEVQEKIHAEIERVLGKSRLPNLDDRKHLNYLEATLKEVLRIEPANPLGLGRVSTEDTEIDGYFIPKGTFIAPNVYHAHHDPKIWGDPENFRPERWLTEEGTLIKKDLTLGFGAGRRLCAGETFAKQTMLLFIGGMLQNFRFTSDEKPDLKDLIPGINMSLKNFWLRAIPR